MQLTRAGFFKTIAAALGLGATVKAAGTVTQPADAPIVKAMGASPSLVWSRRQSAYRWYEEEVRPTSGHLGRELRETGIVISVTPQILMAGDVIMFSDSELMLVEHVVKAPSVGLDLAIVERGFDLSPIVRHPNNSVFRIIGVAPPNLYGTPE